MFNSQTPAMANPGPIKGYGAVLWNDMSAQSTCARCGARLPAAAAGVCSRCEMAAALEPSAPFIVPPLPSAEGDLKPSNIIIDLFDTPRVTDFGLAKRLAPEGEGEGAASTRDITLTGQILGSPNYLAPELASGKVRDLTPASVCFPSGPFSTSA